MKKSQGEIFGVALLFVILILGIVIYMKINSLNPNQNKNTIKETKYKVLAEGTLNTILFQSTHCFTENGKDSVIDMIQYCLYNQNVDFANVPLTCQDGTVVNACKYPITILNKTLFEMYNDSNNTMIPFYMTITLPNYNNTDLSNVNITNFGSYTYQGKKLNYSNYLQSGFNKAPSGLYSVPTAFRNINFDLALYYN